MQDMKPITCSRTDLNADNTFVLFSVAYQHIQSNILLHLTLYNKCIAILFYLCIVSLFLMWQQAFCCKYKRANIPSRVNNQVTVQGSQYCFVLCSHSLHLCKKNTSARLGSCDVLAGYTVCIKRNRMTFSLALGGSACCKITFRTSG